MLRNIEEERAGYERTLAAMRAAETDPAIEAHVTEADRLLREWRIKSADRQVALARDPATRPELTKYVNGSFAAKIHKEVDTVLAAEAELTARNAAQQDRTSARVHRMLIISGLTMLALSACLCWLLTRSIATPVRAMAAAMRRLASGETDVPVPAEGRKDEVGEMAAALGVLKQAARRTEPA